MEPITITTQLDFKSFLKLQYILTYRRPAILIITFAGLVMLLYGISLLINPLPQSDPSSLLVFSLVFLGIFPFLVWRSAKASFNTNKSIREPITYIFTEDQVEIKGASFQSSLAIEKYYKFKELKHWILLYQDKAIYNMINKKDLTSLQLSTIRELMKSATK